MSHRRLQAIFLSMRKPPNPPTPNNKHPNKLGTFRFLRFISRASSGNPLSFSALKKLPALPLLPLFGKAFPPSTVLFPHKHPYGLPFFGTACLSLKCWLQSHPTFFLRGLAITRRRFHTAHPPGFWFFSFVFRGFGSFPERKAPNPGFFFLHG